MGLVLPALVAAGLGAAALGGVLSQHGDGRGGASPPSSKAGSCAARTARATVSLPLSATRRASARATGPDVRVTRTATVLAADGGAVRASATS